MPVWISLRAAAALSFVIAIVLATSGCANPRPLQTSDPRIGDLNEVMAEHETTRLYLRGADGYQHATQVSLSADSVYFVPGRPLARPSQSDRDREMMQRPVSEVDSIAVEYDAGGGRTGALVGAIPGLYLLGKASGCDNSYFGCDFELGVSALATVLTMSLGALIGNVADPNAQVVYRRPIDSYLQNAPSADRDAD